MKNNQVKREPKTEAVYMAVRAAKRIIEGIPKGTAHYIVIILAAIMTRRLVANKGSLATTVQPLMRGLKCFQS